MTAMVFSVGLAAVVVGILLWGLRALPREDRQFLASIPLGRSDDGSWTGVNLTWYGLMQAVGITIGQALTMVLARSVGVTVVFMGVFLPTILAISLVAARWVAGWVEGKRGTFTVGGAVFVALIASVPVGTAVDAVLGTRDTLGLLAALAIGYPLGEGIGRLACVSFGCCYGKPIRDLRPSMRRLLAPLATIPAGATRKACYAGGCEGVPLVPTQAISAVALSVIALAGTGIFVAGYPRLGAALTLSLTHAFRFGVEFLRADHRGRGGVSSYQWMSLVSIPAVVLLFMLSSAGGLESLSPSLESGLAALMSPAVVGGLLVVGVAVFLYLGRSRVTYSIIRFGVRGG